MTFLNPLVLFGMVAAAIPVILHLLNLRKLQKIDFSTLAFLKELQQTKIRRLKLRQIILLIIRTLVVAMIVLAFARPAMRGTIFGTQARSTIVLVLDDSFSMSAQDERGSFFKQAKESAIKLIDLMKEGDEAYLIKLSELPRATVDPATHDFGALRKVLSESQISSIRRPMLDAVLLSEKLLQRSHNANREVYIISDMQQTLFSENLRAVKEAGQASARGNTYFVVQLGSRETPNAAIDSIEVLTSIPEKDKPASVYVSVRNYGKAPLTNYVVSSYLDGVKAAQGNVSIEPAGSASTRLSFTPKRTGFIKGYIELENDAIEPDNRRYFTIYIPEIISIALLSGSENDVQFIRHVLEAGGASGKQSPFSIQETTPQKFPLLDMKNIDVLISVNVKTFTTGDADRIKSFVQRGCGLIIFPGQDMQIDNYNRTLLEALAIPPIEEITQTAGLTFQKIDLDHPIFSTVFEKEQGGKSQDSRAVESPAITKALKRPAGRGARTVVSLSNGSPFLSEHSHGDGKILFYSVAPSLSWSDFPFKGVFAPLIYRSVIYTSPRQEKQASFIAGAEPSISLRNSYQQTAGEAEGGARRFAIISPDQTEELIQPVVRSVGSGFITSTIFAPKMLSMPGFYEIKSGKTSVSVFAVNTDNRESDTRRISQDDLTKFWKVSGIDPDRVQSIKPGEGMQAAILRLRFGVELWKYCIILALLLALVEMAIARDSRKSGANQPVL